MIISTSSNIVSAGYIILVDLFLPVAVGYLVCIFLSSWNVKAIYKDRRSVKLQHVAPFSLIHQEVSEKEVGLVVALLSSLIVASAVAGGFSIVGISQEPSVGMKAPVLFEAGTTDDVIDFTKQVSEDGLTVSRAYLLALSSVWCSSVSKDRMTLFAAMSNDSSDLDKVHWPILTTEAARCLMREEGFAEERRKSFTIDRFARGFSDCSFTSKVKPGILVKADLTVNDDCPIQIHDYWCARYKKDVCVGAIQAEEGFTTINILYGQDENDSSASKVVSSSFSSLYTEDKIGSISVRSIAYLYAVTALPFGDPDASQVALLRMQTDADIHRVKDPVEITEVNLVFLASTLGPALALLSLASIVTYISWRRFVFEPRLQNCNRFYSAHDMLLCASREVSQESPRWNKDGNSITEGMVFGVSQKLPHVGPLWESDDEGSAFFVETELEGRN